MIALSHSYNVYIPPIESYTGSQCYYGDFGVEGFEELEPSIQLQYNTASDLIYCMLEQTISKKFVKARKLLTLHQEQRCGYRVLYGLAQLVNPKINTKLTVEMEPFDTSESLVEHGMKMLHFM